MKAAVGVKRHTAHAVQFVGHQPERRAIVRVRAVAVAAHQPLATEHEDVAEGNNLKMGVDIVIIAI